MEKTEVCVSRAEYCTQRNNNVYGIFGLYICVSASIRRVAAVHWSIKFSANEISHWKICVWQNYNVLMTMIRRWSRDKITSSSAIWCLLFLHLALVLPSRNIFFTILRVLRRAITNDDVYVILCHEILCENNAILSECAHAHRICAISLSVDASDHRQKCIINTIVNCVLFLRIQSHIRMRSFPFFCRYEIANTR